MFNISIIDLQYFQELHDKRYHVDIYNKPLMQRLTHLHQHLIKYSANDLSRVDKQGDAIACMLSMANALNFDLSSGLSVLQKSFVNGLDDITGLYKTERLVNLYRNELGNFAKLLEGYDHVEALQYKQDLTRHLSELFSLFMQIAIEVDETTTSCLQSEYVTKIFYLKQKHIFHAHFHDADLKDNVYKSFVAFNSR